MRPTSPLIAAASALIGSATLGAAPALTIDATIDPASGRVIADVTTPPPGDASSLGFALFEGLDVATVEGTATIGFEISKRGRGENVVTLDASAAQEGSPLRWAIGGSLGPPLVTPEWIEFWPGSPWIPVAETGPRATLDATISLPAGWTLVGSGIATEKEGVWRLAADRPISGVAIIASPDLQSVDGGMGASKVRVFYTGDRGAVAQSIVNSAARITRHYNGRFGEDRLREFSIVLPPDRPGRPRIPYAAERLAVLGANADANPETFLFLARAIARYWWRHASDTRSMDNLMNEAFVEYSAWRTVREFYGDDPHKQLFMSAVRRADGAPLLTEWSPENDEILTRCRGPIALNALENALGIDRFDALLSRALRQKVGTVEEFVALIPDPIAANAFRFDVGLDAYDE